MKVYLSQNKMIMNTGQTMEQTGAMNKEQTGTMEGQTGKMVEVQIGEIVVMEVDLTMVEVMEEVMYKGRVPLHQRQHQYIVLGVNLEDGLVEIKLVDQELELEAGVVNALMVTLDLVDAVEVAVPLKVNQLIKDHVEGEGILQVMAKRNKC